MKAKVTGREYRLKNKRVFIGFGDSGLIHIEFRKLYNVADLCGNEINPPYNYVLKPKLSNKCVFVTNLSMSKDAFQCIGGYFVENFILNQKEF